jgi:hypothetical protein
VERLSTRYLFLYGNIGRFAQKTIHLTLLPLSLTLFPLSAVLIFLRQTLNREDSEEWGGLPKRIPLLKNPSLLDRYFVIMHRFIDFIWGRSFFLSSLRQNPRRKYLEMDYGDY